MVSGSVAIFNTEILDFEAADGGRHPAVLVAMIVDAGELADFPADGHTFEKIIFENEIAGVTAFGKENIFVEGFGADMILNDEILDVFEGKVFGGDGGEVFDPVGDGKLGGGEIVGHREPPRNYNAEKTK